MPSAGSFGVRRPGQRRREVEWDRAMEKSALTGIQASACHGSSPSFCVTWLFAFTSTTSVGCANRRQGQSIQLIILATLPVGHPSPKPAILGLFHCQTCLRQEYQPCLRQTKSVQRLSKSAAGHRRWIRAKYPFWPRSRSGKGVSGVDQPEVEFATHYGRTVGGAFKRL